MTPAVVSKIISMQPSLTMSESEIAQYVIHHTEKVANSTITNIAKASGTSEASINRFCKKLGYKGFNGFKIALAQENFYNSMQSEQVNAYGEGSIGSVLQDYTAMLVSTSAMLDEDVLAQAVNAIKSVKRIYIFSMDSTMFVAQDLELKLTLIGLNVTSVQRSSMFKIVANTVCEDDLVIAIVPTILMKDIYHTVSTCKDRKAQILTITSYDSPKLSTLVDYKFITSDKITAQNAIGLSNNLTFLYAVDVIYCALLQSDRTLRQKKLNVDAVLNDHQRMDNYMLEY